MSNTWYYYAHTVCHKRVKSDIEWYCLINAYTCKDMQFEPCMRCNEKVDCFMWRVNDCELFLCENCDIELPPIYKTTIVRIERAVVRYNGVTESKTKTVYVGWRFEERDIRRFTNVALSLRRSELNSDIVTYIMKQLLWSYAIY